MITDFSSDSPDLGWYVQNDNVMGGRSQGDGRRYTWQLQTNARYRGYAVSYWAEFETRDGEWSTVDIPFSKFYPQFRGFKLDGPELDPRQITEFGLYIYDKKDGPFELHLASVDAYSD